MQQRTIYRLQNLVTIITIGIGLTCIGFAFTGYPVAWLLLAAVTLGTAYDFCSTLLGRLVGQAKPSLEWFARINFAALCFGIPFTSLAASFVVAALRPDSASATLAGWWFELLVASLLFGALFLFARYKTYEVNGAVEYTLDKSHGYTNTIFLIRRVLLAISLLVSLLAVYDGLGTSMAWWFILYGILFIATVPLHILHRPIASMLAEAVTLLVLFYGSVRVFYLY